MDFLVSTSDCFRPSRIFVIVCNSSDEWAGHCKASRPYRSLTCHWFSSGFLYGNLVGCCDWSQSDFQIDAYNNNGGTTITSMTTKVCQSNWGHVIRRVVFILGHLLFKQWPLARLPQLKCSNQSSPFVIQSIGIYFQKNGHKSKWRFGRFLVCCTAVNHYE